MQDAIPLAFKDAVGQLVITQKRVRGWEPAEPKTSIQTSSRFTLRFKESANGFVTQVALVESARAAGTANTAPSPSDAAATPGAVAAAAEPRTVFFRNTRSSLRSGLSNIWSAVATAHQHGVATFQVRQVEADVDRIVQYRKKLPYVKGEKTKYATYYENEYAVTVTLGVYLTAAAQTWEPLEPELVPASEEHHEELYGTRALCCEELRMSVLLQELQLDTFGDAAGQLTLAVDVPDDEEAGQASNSATASSHAVRKDQHPGWGCEGLEEILDPKDVRSAILKLAAPVEWDFELPDPPGLKCQLFPYQRKALAWLAWRESFSEQSGTLPAAPPRANAVLPILAAAFGTGGGGDDDDGCGASGSKARHDFDPVNWNVAMAGYIARHQLWERVVLAPGERSSADATRNGEDEAAPPRQVFFSAPLGRVSLEPPGHAPQVPGGLLSEEMGLGKTVEMLALVLLHPRPPAMHMGAPMSETARAFIEEAASEAASRVTPHLVMLDGRRGTQRQHAALTVKRKRVRDQFGDWVEMDALTAPKTEGAPAKGESDGPHADENCSSGTAATAAAKEEAQGEAEPSTPRQDSGKVGEEGVVDLTDSAENRGALRRTPHPGISNILANEFFAPQGAAQSGRAPASKRRKTSGGGGVSTAYTPADRDRDIDVTRSFAGTLVVVPLTLVQQWVHEIERHTSLNVFVYDGAKAHLKSDPRYQRRSATNNSPEAVDKLLHGAGLTRAQSAHMPETTDEELEYCGVKCMTYEQYCCCPGNLVHLDSAGSDERFAAAMLAQDLMAADVVVTTYATLREEVHMDVSQARGSTRHSKKYASPTSPLVMLAWWRLVMDEAQMVGGGMSLIAQMARKLRPVHRWCVTGTPIGGNGLADLQAHLSVLRHDPCQDPKLWRELIAKPINERQLLGSTRLRAMLKPIMWRNSKAVAARDHPLPPRPLHSAWLNMPPAEETFYRHILNATRSAHLSMIAAGKPAGEVGDGDAADGDDAAGATAGAGASGSGGRPQPARRRASASSRAQQQTESQKALKSVKGKVTELRKACIHPQLTSYWNSLSQDLQLDQAGALSPADILARMISSTQTELQGAERVLCIALDALALCIGQCVLPALRRAAAALAAATGSPLMVNVFDAFNTAAIEAVGGERLSELAGAWRRVPGPAPAPAGGSGKSPNKKKQAATDAELLDEISRLLLQSHRLEEGGIESQAHEEAVGDEKIEAAESAWRAWKYQGIFNSAARAIVAHAAGRDDEAKAAAARVDEQASSLETSVTAARDAVRVAAAAAAAAAGRARCVVMTRWDALEASGWHDTLARTRAAAWETVEEEEDTNDLRGLALLATVPSSQEWLAAFDENFAPAPAEQEAAASSMHAFSVNASDLVDLENDLRSVRGSVDAAFGSLRTAAANDALRSVTRALGAQAPTTRDAALPTFDRPPLMTLLRAAVLGEPGTATAAARALRAAPRAGGSAMLANRVESHRRAVEKLRQDFAKRAGKTALLSEDALFLASHALTARTEFLRASRAHMDAEARVAAKQGDVDKLRAGVLERLERTGNPLKRGVQCLTDSDGNIGTLRRACTDLQSKCRELASRKRFLQNQQLDLASSAAPDADRDDSSEQPTQDGNNAPASASGAANTLDAATAPGVMPSVQDATPPVTKSSAPVCPVCTDRIEGRICLFPCGHAFCDECAGHVIGPTGAGICPMDRRPVNAKKVFYAHTHASGAAASASAPHGAHQAEATPEIAALTAIQPSGQWLTKISALLRRILHLNATAPSEKSLVFSQFPDALSLVGKAFTVNGIKFASIINTNKQAVRKALATFQEDPSVKVFLLSLGTSAAGLTLTRASHVFLLEPAIEPAIEQQAIARVHRYGQERPVSIVRLLVSDTVEPIVLQQSESKARLFDAAGTGEGVGAQGHEREAMSMPTMAPTRESLEDRDVSEILDRLFH